MSLHDLELSGAIKREELTSGEINRFQLAIQERLVAASLDANPNRTRFEQAYDAILNCAWIALRVEGYRATSKQGHHRVVLESLAETMGIPNKEIDYFLSLSELRNRDLYDAMPATDSDVVDALQAATELAEKVTAWVKFRLESS